MNAGKDAWSTLLTASGAGAIGVIRVCGPGALTAMAALFHSKQSALLTADSFRDGRLRYGRLIDGDELLDDVLVAEVADAATPTFDITAHGGVRVLERILTALEARGVSFRASGPNAVAFPSTNTLEFDACRALRYARSERAVRFLARQRSALPHHLREIAGSVLADPVAARSALGALLRRTPAAIHLVQGVTVVLVGPPNSGKSTLFNRLVGRSAAIVSPLPGTTRDWISVELDMRGLPVTLIDTAGIRSDADALEGEAIARGQDQAQSAAISLLVLDATQPPPADFAAFHARKKPPLTVLLNKSDVSVPETDGEWERAFLPSLTPRLRISAVTGLGLDALADLILAEAGFDTAWDSSHSAFFTIRQEEMARGILNLAPAEFLSSAKDMLLRLVAAE